MAEHDAEIAQVVPCIENRNGEWRVRGQLEPFGSIARVLGPFSPWCSCGWEGPQFGDSNMAAVMLGQHIRGELCPAKGCGSTHWDGSLCLSCGTSLPPGRPSDGRRP